MKLVKEHINEKFQEKSDPIKDMGIGIDRNYILRRLNKLDNNEAVPYVIYDTAPYNTSYLEIGYLYNNRGLTTLQKSNRNKIIDIVNDVVGDEFFSKIGIRNWDSDGVICTAIIKPEYAELFKSCFDEEFGPGDLLYEKFTEEGDPIKDMGIGDGLSFDTLRPGAIFVVNPNFKSGIALTYNHSGKFTSWHSGQKLSSEYFFIPYSINSYKSENVKDIYFKKFYRKTDAIEFRNAFEEAKKQGTGTIPWFGDPLRMIVSKLQFERRFNIIERGFFINESVNEKFSKESDPIEDMDIGITRSYVVKRLNRLKNTEGITNFSFWELNGVSILEMRYRYRETNPAISWSNAKDKLEHIINNVLGEELITYKSIKPWFNEPDTIHLTGTVSIKPEYAELFKSCFSKKYIRDAADLLSEKFQEESDPIRDMNIGGYTFNTLRLGSIFKLKPGVENVYISRMAKKIKVSKKYLGIYLNQDSHLVIIMPTNKWISSKGGDKFEYRLTVAVMKNEERAKEYKEGLRIWRNRTNFTPFPNYQPHGYQRIFDITERQFDKIFEIVDRGFPINESVNEKFQEEGDPIADMGIGGFSFDTMKNGTIVKCTKSFGTTLGGVIRGYNDAAKQVRIGSYLLIYDIRKLDRYYISFNYRNAGGPIYWGDKETYKKQGVLYLETAKRFQKEYKDDPTISPKILKYSGGFISKIGRNKFDNMFEIIEPGFHITKSMNEKFQEESDPIRDMDIGGYTLETLKPGAILRVKPDLNLYVNISMLAHKIRLHRNPTSAGRNIKEGEHLVVTYIQTGVFEKIGLYFALMKNEEHAIEYKNMFRELNKLKHHARIQPIPNPQPHGNLFSVEITHKEFERVFEIVDRGFRASEFVNEKFSEEGDPIKDMGIGLQKTIEAYINKNDEDEIIQFGYTTPAIFISISDLNEEIKKDWIEFLLNQGKEKLVLWEEGDVYEMYNNIGVKFIPNSKTLPDSNLHYEIKNGVYYLYAGVWQDFIKYIKLGSDIGEEFLERLLDGDAYRYFTHYGDVDLGNIVDSLSVVEQQNLFDYLTPICTEHSEEIKNAKNLYDLLKILADDSQLFEKIGRDVLYAYADTISNAEEQAAYNDVISTIKRKLSISEVDYKDDTLVLKISEQGLEKLFVSYYLEEERIPYYPPPYGWSGDFNYDFFIEEIQNRLD